MQPRCVGKLQKIDASVRGPLGGYAHVDFGLWRRARNLGATSFGVFRLKAASSCAGSSRRLLSCFSKDIEDVLAQIITATEKQRLISARLGQGKFRSQVLERWQNACAVTGSRTLTVIRASHCKPWRSCTNEERLDPANGLPLVATLDALFDAGLITFANNGDVTVSPRLQGQTLRVNGLRLTRVPTASEKLFLDYHRREIYKA